MEDWLQKGLRSGCANARTVATFRRGHVLVGPRDGFLDGKPSLLRIEAAIALAFLPQLEGGDGRGSPSGGHMSSLLPAEGLLQGGDPVGLPV